MLSDKQIGFVTIALILTPSMLLDCFPVSTDLAAVARPDTILHLASYIPHDPIVITHNSNFSALGFPGGGTEGNPYLVYNLDVESIYIMNTDCHFIINQCKISTVVLTGVVNGRVEACNVVSSETCIKLEDSANCNVSSCTIDSVSLWEVGLKLTDSEQCHIFDNTFTSSGIILVGSSDCTIHGNTLEDLDEYKDAISLEGCRSCSVTENVVSDADVGILLSSCVNCTIANCILGGCGLYVEGIYEVNVANLSVNGRPLGYFYGIHNTTLNGTEYGQVFLAYCSNVTLLGGTYSGFYNGLLIHGSDLCTIEGVTFTNSLWHAVRFQASWNCTLLKSTIDRNWRGILIDSDCRFIEVLDNSVTWNWGRGIDLDASRCKVIGNDVLNNLYIGIDVSGDYNIIYYNTIYYNQYSNAYDTGTGNIWDDGVSMGNYWNDAVKYYVYVIPGHEYHPELNAVDHFPNGVKGGSKIPPRPRPTTIFSDTDMAEPDPGWPQIAVVAVSGAVALLIVLYLWDRRRLMAES